MSLTPLSVNTLSTLPSINILPKCNNETFEAVCLTKSMSWPTTIKVIPCLFKFLTISPVILVSSTDKPAVGSSKKTKSGFEIVDKAISSHCFFP